MSSRHSALPSSALQGLLTQFMETSRPLPSPVDMHPSPSLPPPAPPCAAKPLKPVKIRVGWALLPLLGQCTELLNLSASGTSTASTTCCKTIESCQNRSDEEERGKKIISMQDILPCSAVASFQVERSQNTSQKLSLQPFVESLPLTRLPIRF